MRIVDLLNVDSIVLNAAPSDKTEAIDILVDLQMKSGNVSDKSTYKRDILAREKISSTAVGDGIAIPHAKSTSVKAPSLAAITVPSGVDYDSPDGELSNILFMIAAPQNGDVHLEVLSHLMAIMMDEDFRSALLSAKSKNEFMKVIENAESKKYDKPDDATDLSEDNRIRVLAVTGCPTGIAHTYMAAEALLKAGEKLNIGIKVETNGSGGAKNVLTKEEIEKCDGIIVASDKSTEMSRFDGKKLILTSVSDGIRIPEELIRKIADGEAEVYSHSGEIKRNASDGENTGRKLYKQLMNGVSNMLPFTVAGGIFTAIAFLIDTFSGAPQDGNFGSYTEAARFFKTVGGYTFEFMLPILSAYIGKSIADRPGFLVGAVGGFLAAAGSTFADVGGGVPSGFLGALLAGFTGGYLMLGVKKLCDRLPDALNGIKAVLIYPVAGLGIAAVTMCLVNPFMGIINTKLSEFLSGMGSSSKILLGCILGGMMAIDMGGPFNKAAYVFGTAATASGGYDIMAAVMVGGMVPPIAIALATTFFKNLWTDEERKSGAANYIMGLSFITEGAIPYAAADPIRVIPSCIVGAATAGGLSMLFDCTLMAPHGGIFVFAVVGNWPLYVLSLAAGSLAGMTMLALLKRKKSHGGAKIYSGKE